MSARRIAGVALVVVGIVALVWGGSFWTDRNTVVDAGPLEITTAERDGIAVPPVAGVIAIVGGIALLMIPKKQGA